MQDIQWMNLDPVKLMEELSQFTSLEGFKEMLDKAQVMHRKITWISLLNKAACHLCLHLLLCTETSLTLFDSSGGTCLHEQTMSRPLRP